MKFNIFNLCFLLAFITLSCTAQNAKNAKKVPLARTYLKWDQDFVEYGKVKKGEKRNHTYKFQNISKEDVEISICTACNCTTLDWTSKIVKPGEFGVVETIFDSTEKNESETINITIILKNTDAVLHYPIVDEVKFHFDLEK